VIDTTIFVQIVKSIIGYIIISHGVLNAGVLWGCNHSIVGQELD